jgi:hypothetical protein
LGVVSWEGGVATVRGMSRLGRSQNNSGLARMLAGCLALPSSHRCAGRGG